MRSYVNCAPQTAFIADKFFYNSFADLMCD